MRSLSRPLRAAVLTIRALAASLEAGLRRLLLRLRRRSLLADQLGGLLRLCRALDLPLGSGHQSHPFVWLRETPASGGRRLKSIGPQGDILSARPF